MKNIQIGDRFKGGSNKYILSTCGSSKIILINLSNGNIWSGPTEVEDICRIKRRELDELIGANWLHSFSRYKKRK